jgi:hypothetical protein
MFKIEATARNIFEIFSRNFKNFALKLTFSDEK